MLKDMMTGFELFQPANIDDALLRAGFLTFERLHMTGPAGEPMQRLAVRHPGAAALVPASADHALDIGLHDQLQDGLGDRAERVALVMLL